MYAALLRSGHIRFVGAALLLAIAGCGGGSPGSAGTAGTNGNAGNGGVAGTSGNGIGSEE